MKVRFTSNVFLAVAFFFVMALAGCKPVEMAEDENDSTSDPASTHANADESEAAKVVDEFGGMTQEEKSLSQYQITAKVGAHAKYLKRYEAGQRVFILGLDLKRCRHGNNVDCSDDLGKLLAELSQVCEIADIETMNGGFFVEFQGSHSWNFKTGVTATTALLVRVSSCGEKKME